MGVGEDKCPSLHAPTPISHLPTPAVFDLLTHLVDKSLVMMEPEGGRYRLLETVRQYAEEHLDAAAEALTVRTRHLQFFLSMAEAAQPELIGPRQAEFLRRLETKNAKNGWRNIDITARQTGR